MLIGQALSLPLAKETIWRWVFSVSFFLAIAQMLGSFFVEAPSSSGGSEGSGDEEQPLLSNGNTDEGRAMSIKELFTSKGVRIRRGLIVVIVTQICQQIVGISPVMCEQDFTDYPCNELTIALQTFPLGFSSRSSVPTLELSRFLSWDGNSLSPSFLPLSLIEWGLDPSYSFHQLQ